MYLKARQLAVLGSIRDRIKKNKKFMVRKRRLLETETVLVRK